MSPQENHSLTLFLIDDDPVFRLGLRIWLNRFADMQVIDEAETGAIALERLQTRLEAEDVDQTEGAIALLSGRRQDAEGQGQIDRTEEAIAPSTQGIDLVILNLNLGQANPGDIQGLNLCDRIKTQYPSLPVLLLSALTEPVILAAAQQAKADGFCVKSLDVTELESAIRRVASGQSYWPQLARTGNLPVGWDTPPTPPLQTVVPSPLAIARRNLRLSGLRQIDAALAAIQDQLQNLDLPLLDRAILAGQARELRVSRWLVKRLLATPSIPEPKAERLTVEQSRDTVEAIAPIQSTRLAESSAIAPQSLESAVGARSIQGILMDSVLSKLQTGLVNQTGSPLEIDILREDKKRELFYLILRKLEDVLDELRYSQVQPEQLVEKRSPILIDLWQGTVTDFFGKYYTVPVRNQDIEVVSTLLNDVEIVQAAFLDKVPMVLDLLAHLLFQTPLLVDGALYSAGNPESLARAEALLDHLLIQVANGVMQPLLNHFASVETIKQNFYVRHLMSNREIERFRNNLSWKYRLAQYVDEPKAIFESQYCLLVLHGSGIKQISIYAPRGQELDQLSGIQFLLTLALETRDAIAPRIRSAISVVGGGLVYILTEVIGRGIGLVGRGVLKGIGNAWQDSRYSRRDRG
ncbi:MAG TPA: DUF3685 domain-containing protein [Crinalium sp.]